MPESVFADAQLALRRRTRAVLAFFCSFLFSWGDSRRSFSQSCLFCSFWWIRTFSGSGTRRAVVMKTGFPSLHVGSRVHGGYVSAISVIHGKAIIVDASVAPE